MQKKPCKLGKMVENKEIAIGGKVQVRSSLKYEV